jgi:hypothetical protein
MQELAVAQEGILVTPREDLIHPTEILRKLPAQHMIHVIVTGIRATKWERRRRRHLVAASPAA